MKKFDFKKWIVENKHGKAPSFSNYSGRFGKINEQEATTYGSNPAYIGPQPTNPGDVVSGSNITQSNFDFNTDCAGFNEIPQDFQDLICSSCDGGQINMHCECCEESSTGGPPAVDTFSPSTSVPSAGGQNPNNSTTTSTSTTATANRKTKKDKDKDKGKAKGKAKGKDKGKDKTKSKGKAKGKDKGKDKSKLKELRDILSKYRRN